MITLSAVALAGLLTVAYLVGVLTTASWSVIQNSRIVRRGLAQHLKNAETVRRLVEAAIATGQVEGYLATLEDGAERRTH